MSEYHSPRVTARPIVRGIGVALAAAILLPTMGAAQVPKPVRKQIRAMLKQGTLYARIDMPCKTGRHPFGTYKAPLVEVTRDGENTEGGLGMNMSVWHHESTYWGVRPNDALKFDEGEFDGSDFEAEFVGVGAAKGNNTVLLFKNIGSLEDFEAAFEHAFARMPLQDEHPDWAPEFRDAVGARRLVEGMNKRQAFYVIGSPERVEQSEAGGSKVEIWFPRQDRGMKTGFWTTRSKTTGYPTQLKFVDNRLVELSGSVGGGLSLDD